MIWQYDTPVKFCNQNWFSTFEFDQYFNIITNLYTHVISTNNSWVCTSFFCKELHEQVNVNQFDSWNVFFVSLTYPTNEIVEIYMYGFTYIWHIRICMQSFFFHVVNLGSKQTLHCWIFGIGWSLKQNRSSCYKYLPEYCWKVGWFYLTYNTW